MEEKLLRGKDEIAAYVGVSWPTAKRFIEQGGLPAMKFGKRWFASPSAIDDWKADRLKFKAPQVREAEA